MRTQCAANKPEVAALLQKYQEKVQAETRRPEQAADRTHHVIV
jgi:hypothetical protein